MAAILLLLIGCPDTTDVEEQVPKPLQGMQQIEDPNHPQGGFWIDRFEYPNKEGEIPLSSTTLKQAIESCSEQGKRLCTASEWRRACHGNTGRYRFSYGERYRPKICHLGIHLASGHSSMMKPEDSLARSGANSSCASIEGVFDMIGNLEEWVLDDWRGASGSLEGGAWYTFHEYADCSGKYSRQPDYRISPNRQVLSAGFRCCWTPEEPTQEDIQIDRIQRQKAAKDRASSKSYEPKNEVEIGAGTFIDRYEYPNIPGEHPITAVTWEEASALCTEAGKRLCEAYEWEQACSGLSQWKYPYGEKYIYNSCPISLQEPTESGKYIGCISPNGAYDMVGNVWEWTNTPLDAVILKNNDEQELKELRGGSWFVDKVKGVCLPEDGYPAGPSDFSFPDVGFRCCRGEKLSLPQASLGSAIQCPDDMVGQHGYCIDKYEFPNREGEHPTADLDFHKASTLCQEKGKRLCTEEEWEAACAGQKSQRWPYGNQYDSTYCRDLGGRAEEGGGGTRPSGAFPKCVTEDGIFDMSGNLWEWTTTKANTRRGVIRGGGWNLSAGLGQCRSRAAAQQNYHAGEVGARCCAGPEQAKKLRK